MTEALLTFQKFNDENLAKELIKKLDDIGVRYEIEDDQKLIDPIYSLIHQREIKVKLRPQDFEFAQNKIEAYYKNLVDDVESDYYLFDFTDQELIEIVMKPDEWGDFDYQLAQKLLKERGIEIKPKIIELLKKQRNDDLTTPETSNRFVLYLGYISAFLGGFFGIFIGYHLAYNKKTLPDGKSLYRYSEAERNHGTRILLISAVALMFWISYRWYINN